MSRLVRRMVARDPRERGRTSSPLELLFDLTFVAAISTAAAQFALRIEEGRLLEGLGAYLFVFFAMWWAWMNFTWFASSYDTDDVPYRLLTLVSMAGVLVLAASTILAYENLNLVWFTIGYVMMRIALVAQWLRAAVQDPTTRSATLRYAAGFAGCQVLWVVRLALPPAWQLPATAILVALELSVPIWAERRMRTTPHPRHIAERYGLFVNILLGEGILGATVAIRSALVDERGLPPGLVTIGVSALVIVAGVWWLYFSLPAGDGLARSHPGRFYFWGYGHYLLFAAIAAIGTGIEVAIVSTVGERSAESGPSAGTVVGSVAVPLAVALLAMIVLHAPFVRPAAIPPLAAVIAVVLILLTPLFASTAGAPVSLVVIAAVVAGLVAVTLAVDHRRSGAAFA